MAQVFNLVPRGPRSFTASNTVTLLAAGNQTILETEVTGIEKVSFQVQNTVQALDAFVVQGKVHPDADWVTYASAAGDFSAPSGRILSATGSLVTLAASAAGRFDMDTGGLYAVKVLASAAVDGAVVSIYANGSGGISNSNVTLTTGDIEIGAVELKNATDDTRAKIAAVNTLAAADVGVATAMYPITSEVHVGEVGGRNAMATSIFNRTNDANAYASGDLVAQSTTVTACSAPAITLGRGASGVAATGMLRRLRLRKTGNSITNASFRVHFFNANPTPTSAVTITSANPGVVTWAAHGLATGCPVVFTTTGALPTNVVAGTVYYAIAIDANTFWLASSAANAYAGTKIDCSAGAQSGVQTAYAGIAVGDNGVLSFGQASKYVGKVDVVVDQAFTDGGAGNGIPVVGSEINFAAQTYYWLLEARAAYTPIASETFEIACEVLQN